MHTSDICDRVASVFDKYDKAYSMGEVRNLIDRWESKKAPLIDLLRKHPNWNEDSLAIVWDHDTIREVNGYDYFSHIDYIINAVTYDGSVKLFDGTKSYVSSIDLEYRVAEVNSEDDGYMNKYYIVTNRAGEPDVNEMQRIVNKHRVNDSYNILDIIRKLKYVQLTRFIDNGGGFDEFVNNDIYDFRVGQKTSRAIRSTLIRYGVDKIVDSYADKINKIVMDAMEANSPIKPTDSDKIWRYAEEVYEDELLRRVNLSNYEFHGANNFERICGLIADDLSPLSINRHTVLSVHPCDYLEMSNIDNSWSSCHNIESGCYMAGTLSYMCDDCSMIFYTVDKEYSGTDYYKQPKINRQVYCYEDGVLLQSRLYPDYRDSVNSNNFRAAVQSVFAKCENMPNIWKLKRGNKEVERYTRTHSDAKHYPDYEYSRYEATISLLEGFGDSHDHELVIGSPCYCINCGENLDDTESINCDGCNGCHVCEECGSMCHEADMYYDADNDCWYCSDCVNYCGECGCVIYPGSENYVDSACHYVCDWCYENKYDTCDRCGEIYKIDEMVIRDNGEKYCNECVEEYFVSCDECGCLSHEDDMVWCGDKMLCEDCADRYEEVESEEE